MTDFSQIKGNEAAKRAIAIAIAGSHPIHLYGPHGCGKKMLSQAAGVILEGLGESAGDLISIGYPCECGNRNDPGRACECEPNQVKALPRDRMVCEVPRIPFDELFSSVDGTSTEQVIKIIKPADSADYYAREAIGMSPDSKQMLRMVYQDCGLSHLTALNVVEVAKTICLIDLGDTIQAEHIAESIAYHYLG